MKEVLLKEMEKIKELLWEINEYIYKNPELGGEEYKACVKLTEFLKENDFLIEKNIVGNPTAFRATYKSKVPGPCVAYLCEYDALPGIGHGCGHNMIGTISVGAAVALSKVLEQVGGEIVVLGTPAEETNGAKVAMAKEGVFNGVDVAMMVHPSGESCESGTSLAMDAIQFAFKGKTAHAAAAPEKGINALDAVLLTFSGINALRQHVKSDVRIHGIIKEGGIAANIVPDKGVAQFYIRAKDRQYLDTVVEKVKNVARGAALMTGAELEISNYELSYDNLITNLVLSRSFSDNLKELGILDIKHSKEGNGSVDMGNVSHVVPAIHPYIGLGSSKLIGHTKEMADATITKEAKEMLLKAAIALAHTGYDVLTDSHLLKAIKEEFVNR